MNWLNKKVAESPYKLAIIGGIVISIVASTCMGAIQSWLPSFDSKGLEAVDQFLSGPPIFAAILLFAIMVDLFADILANNNTFCYLYLICGNTRKPFSRHRASSNQFLFGLASHENRLN